jgi:ATP-dependent Clp endopeptidase proteolytic subunit ClpP
MHSSVSWGIGKAYGGGASKKRKRPVREPATPLNDDDEEEGSGPAIPFPLLMGGRGASVYSSHSCVFFNDDVSHDTIFALNKELRAVADKLVVIATIHKMPPPPIWLHITTNGGDIYSAFSAIDCIEHLPVPVYTVCDGFVASAGTLISVCGAKRFIMPNAYMLIHQLRSSLWGKMSDITDEVSNLQKIMGHLTRIYGQRTSIAKKDLEKILKKDLIWSAAECMEHGVVDEVFKGYVAI